MNHRILIASLLALVTSACEPQVAGLGSFLEENAPPDSCLLAYNTALVDEGEDACCFRNGESNDCDAHRPCNQLSGGQCCVLYSTVHSTIGHACCIYEGGIKKPSGWADRDVTGECKALVNSP